MNIDANINDNSIVKEIVAENFQAAKIFEKYGIDFCCKGNQSLNKAAEEKSINLGNLIKELEITFNADADSPQKFNEWNLIKLSSYILENHHSYVRESIPRIQNHLTKVENRHGAKHTFIADVNRLFNIISDDLYAHMMKEEKVLFPIVKYLDDCRRFGEKPKSGGYGTIKNPIAAMESEHEGAGNIMEEIRNLTNDYRIPEDACTTFKLTYSELQEFEEDLHKHVHLENNILFPKAIKLEEELS